MNRHPDIVSMAEVLGQSVSTACRWSEGAIGLATLVDFEGQPTGFSVSGPTTAKVFASLSARAGFSPDDVAVSATSMLRPLLEADPLKEIGYMIVSHNLLDYVGSACLVILSPTWVQWLEEFNTSIIATAREQLTKARKVT